MKKFLFIMAALIMVLNNLIYADDYKWDFVNSLVGNNIQKIEEILKTNANTMSIQDKRLIMNFSLNYSYGENAIKVLNLLLKYNIYPNTFDLYTAINRNQSNAVIQLLLHIGVEPNGEILLLTMEKRRFDLAKLFIEKGVDVNYQYPLSKSYADGMTPLLYAAKWNNLEMVKLLMENGANVNIRAVDGNTPLSMASANSNEEMHNYLKRHGANENNIIMPQQNTGVSSLIDNQSSGFQEGAYRLFNGSMDMIFSENGNISYKKNGRQNYGQYKVEGQNIIIIMEGRTFVYKIDSNISFSGNGEVWIRVGN